MNTESPRAARKRKSGIWLLHKWANGQYSFSRELSEVIEELDANALNAGDMQAQIEGTLRDAAKGRLRVTDKNGALTIKRSKTQPIIWEIPRNIRKKEVRIYTSDPDSGPIDILALLIHVKVTRGVTVSIMNRLQNRKMKEAADRYRDGKDDDWFHTGPNCTQCVTL